MNLLSRRDLRIMRNAGILASTISYALIGFSIAQAHWKPEYAQASQATKNWYETRELTKAAQARFNFKSCCNNSDVVKTKFKIGGKGNDEWWWLDENTWKRIPDDVIHWGESSPDGQAVMFAIGKSPTCFYPPESGQ